MSGALPGAPSTSVSRNADDGEPRRRGVGQTPLEALADRVLAEPEGLGEPLVDDGDVAILALLISRERAAGDQRNSVRGEKIPVRPGDGQSLFDAGPGGVLDGGRPPLAVGVERKIAGDRSGPDAGQCTQPLLERAIEPSRPRGLAVADERQPHLRGQHVGRADAINRRSGSSSSICVTASFVARVRE
jgi:hypothetical protein